MSGDKGQTASGSTRSSEHFCQMTNNELIADVRDEIFETQIANGCFIREQTVAKLWATTEMRTNLPLLIVLYGIDLLFF